MRVAVCGARGSTTASGRAFERIGAHTSCLAVAADGQVPSLLLDAGTGIREVTALLGGRPFDGTIVLGHLHWDHVIGLPFFAGGDQEGASVQVLLPEQGFPAGEVLDRLMGPPLFPITTEHLRGSWTFGNYDEGWFDVRGFRILAREVPHKGGRTMGLRVEYGASSLAYLPDHAPQDLGPGARGLGVLHEAALELAAGVDLLVHDAQYTALELPRRGAFGHAAAEYAVDLAVAAGARRVALFHHDPARTDAEVAAICDMLRRQAREAGHSVDIVAAHANAIFTI